MKALLVHQSPTTLAALEAMIEAGGVLACRSYVDPVAALEAAHAQRFVVVVLDHRMHTLDGLALTRRLRALAGYEQVPIVLMTTTASRKVRIDALQAGVTECLPPLPDTPEVRLRMQAIIATGIALRGLGDRIRGLERDAEAAGLVLRQREEEMIVRLSHAVEYRDNDTGRHTVRVARYSRILAEELGLPPRTCDAICLTAPLHDLGKVAIPDAILLKQGRLDAGEFAVVKGHAAIGAEILDGSSCDLIQLAAEIASGHHERWDGTGYPRGLKGARIPLAARIVAIADVFDALTSPRPYKSAISPDDALVHIAHSRGTQFDPACVDAFLAAKARIMAVVLEMTVALPQAADATRPVGCR